MDNFSSLFEFLPIGAYRTLPDGLPLRANPALVALIGYDSEAEMLACVRDIAIEWYVDPQRRALFRRLLESDGRVTGFESEIWRQKTRERIWVSENAHVVRDAAGRIQYFEGTVEEITARKRAEQALRENSELWKRALESTGDGVWDWNVASGVEIYSPQCKALYGYADDELPNLPEALDGLTHPEDVERMRRDREDHFAGRTPAYVNEHRVLCKDGQWKWILSRGIVISRDAAGRPLRVVGTHTDITGSKQAEALRFERDRAAAADQAKSHFLSRVSHELRTPLNAILGFAQLLDMDAGASARQRAWIGHVLASGRHLLALMDDILDISSVQTGELPMTLESLPLRPVVEEAWAMLAGAAQEAGIAVIDEVPPGSALVVRADRRRLKQIVSNLLSNAIKYNRRGGWVRLRAQAAGDQVELAVTDSGPGLDEAQRARLFQPFERLGAQHGPVAGTGLGLALSRQLTDAMGGTIEVDSTPGEGSTFRVRLPSA
jgi:PAS domain S-box-containing protein